jgi:hypothetical protein
MTEEDKKFFEDARSMFLTPGWEAFKADIQQAYESIDYDNCDSSNKFWTHKGARNALSFVLYYEEATLANEAQQEEDNASYL